MEAVVEKPEATRNKTLAESGDNAAERFLVRIGYQIVERNWKCAAGTADIIAFDKENNCLVFVDVDTRRSMSFPSGVVSKKKRERFEHIALMYLTNNDFNNIKVRFDVVSVRVLGSDRCMIRHHVNAFSVGD